MFFYYIKQTLRRHNDDVVLLTERIRDKDVTINNHIDHLTEACSSMKECLIKLDGKIDANSTCINTMGDKIVAAIRDQSELMKEIARYTKEEKK